MLATGADTSQRVKLTKSDWGIAALLTAATMLFVARHIHWPIVPMEDASMLLRYSQNVARGHGIVWNVGEHPLEGATDFLFMFLIGMISRVTGFGVKPVAAGILFVSHAASVAVLYAALRKLYRAPMLLAGGFAVMLGAGIGFRYVDTAFSAPFYALFALLTWYVGTVCILEGVTWPRALGFAALGFVTGLIRPDGVILAVLMLCSTLYGMRSGWVARKRLLVSFGAIFVVLGGAYFGWRLHYFGYPFPNPYYIKHMGGGKFGTLKSSSRAIVEMLLPVLPLAALGLRNRASRRHLATWLITVIPFTSVWMMIALENNHFSRFQYVMVPLSLLSLGGMTATWWRDLNRDGLFDKPARRQLISLPLAGLLVGLVVFAVYYNLHLYVFSFTNLGAQQLAERLKPYASKNYTMVVTEAGDLPFYSEWKAVDALGLNDAYVAHHGGGLSQAYLDSYHPEVVLYRVWDRYRSVEQFQAQWGERIIKTDDQLTSNDMLLNQYAKQRGYVLAAVWGSEQCQSDVYWVRPDFADRDAILAAIRDYPYYTQGSGALAYDFKGAPAPTSPCYLP